MYNQQCTRYNQNQNSIHLDGERHLPLALELSKNGDHIHFQKPEHVRLDEFIKLFVFVFESLRALPS